MGVCVPGGVRRRRRGLPLLHPRARGALARRRRRRRHGRGPHERLHAADPRLRHRRAAVALRAAARARRGHRRLRADRAGGRLRRRRAPHDAPSRTATAGRSPARSSGSRTARTPSTFLLFARTEPDTPGAQGVSAFILDADHIRVTRDEEKLGLNSSVTNDIVGRGRRGRARPAPARGGQGLHRRDGDARRRADRDRRPGARDRAGGVRRRARVREGAPHVRQARSASTRRSSGSSRTCRRRSTPRACSSTAPRG